jgi:hypothetical protein
MPLILGANQLTAGGYEVDNSLRFNSASNDYLSRTPASASNRQIFTVSFWFKKVTSGVANGIMIHGQNTGNNDFSIYNSTDDKIQIFSWNASSAQFTLATTQVLRDVSAWYHMVVACDTTQATASNRVKLYLNGSQITAFDQADYPSQNANLNYNTTDPYWIGRSYSNAYRNLYLSEFYSIDGQQLTPSSFGETDEDTNIWKPKAYTGTFGTNGFYLEFKDSSALGDDTSGNGNDFTVNNLTSIDQTTDTPTNNFATLNNLNKGTNGISLSNGNNTYTSPSGSYGSVLSTIGFTTGKWYFEYKWISGDNSHVGIAKENINYNTYLGGNANAYSYFRNGQKWNNNSGSAYGDAYVTGDIIGVAVDLNNGALWFSKNGTWQNSATQAQIEAGTTTNSAFTGLTGEFFFAVGMGESNEVADFNFGNPPFTISSGNADANGYGNFEYAVPSGYYALCTKNLAEYG